MLPRPLGLVPLAERLDELAGFAAGFIRLGEET